MVRGSSASQVKKPQTIPTAVIVKDGVEWLRFTYTSKGATTEFEIRTDIESVPESALDPQFKQEQSIYPRANVERSRYQGNRWDYESTVNEIGWRLCYLNQRILLHKRGLLQRAVDSFRNQFSEMKSRRAARVDKSIAETRDTKKGSRNPHQVLDEFLTEHGAPPRAKPSLINTATTKSQESRGKRSSASVLEDDLYEPSTSQSGSRHRTGKPDASFYGYTSSPSNANKKQKIIKSSSVYAQSIGSDTSGSRPKTFSFDYEYRGIKVTIEFRVDLESVPVHSVGDAFKKKYMLFGSMDPPDSSLEFHSSSHRSVVTLESKPPSSLPSSQPTFPANGPSMSSLQATPPPSQPTQASDEEDDLLDDESSLEDDAQVESLMSRWNRKLLYNDLAWKFAYLNPSLFGEAPTLLQRAIDVYVTRHFGEKVWPRPSKVAVLRAGEETKRIAEQKSRENVTVLNGTAKLVRARSLT